MRQLTRPAEGRLCFFCASSQPPLTPACRCGQPSPGFRMDAARTEAAAPAQLAGLGTAVDTT